MDVTFSAPPANKVGKLLDRFTNVIEETIGTGRAELLRALVHRPLIKRLESVTDRVWETTMLLVLRAPVGLLRQLEPHLNVLEAWLKAPGDSALKAQWESEARPAIVRALRKRTRPLWRRLLRL